MLENYLLLACGTFTTFGKYNQNLQHCTRLKTTQQNTELLKQQSEDQSQSQI